jgi:sec-independent protein translocase protein TatA
MGEFSLPHILIVLVIVLVFFGPSRLPGLGKSLGEAIRGFKQGITPDDNSNNQAQQSPPPAQQNLHASQQNVAHLNQPVQPTAQPVVQPVGQTDIDPKNTSGRS